MSSSSLTLDLTSVIPSAGGVAVVAAGVSGGLIDVGVQHRCLVTSHSAPAWRDLLRTSEGVELSPVSVNLSQDSRWQNYLRKTVPHRLRPHRVLKALRRGRARSVAGKIGDGVVWNPFHRAPATSSSSVVTVHDLRVFEQPWASRADRSIIAANVESAAAIVCSWPHPYEHLLRLFPSAKEKSFLIPLPAMHRGLFRERSAPKQSVRLLYPAALTPHKNHEVLVRAMALLPQATLVCTGPSEPRHAAKVKRLARRLGVEDRIEWRGFVSLEELEEAYRASDLLVIPSRWEAASGPILEAVTRGMPIVASAIPPLLRQLHELAIDTPTFAWDDHEGLAAGVQIAVHDYVTMVEQLRRPASLLSSRTWTDCARDYQRVFEWVDGQGEKPRDLMRDGPG